MRELFEFSVRTIAATRGRASFKLFDKIRGDLQGTRAQLDARSIELLRGILVHAAETTQAYKQRFDSVGFQPQKIEHPDELKRLPILHKQDLRDNLPSYFSSSAVREKCQKKSTSGSSGQPLVFYRDHEYYQLGEAGTMRNLSVAGWEPGDAIGYVWGYEKETGGALGNWKSFLSRTFYLNAFRQSPESMKDWVRTLEQFKVRYLYGYPSSVQLFAKFVLDQKISMPMKAVFCTAEKYMQVEREEIERAFGCKSYDLYGSSEIQNAAFECRQGKMHIATDFVHAFDFPSEDNSPPRLILTSFHNRCLPFICYDLGDFGRVIEETCPCGIHTPLVEIYGGSRYDFLRTKEGIVHGAVLERIFNKISGVQRYQIVQHELKRYTVRAEFSPGSSSEESSVLEKTTWEVFRRVFGDEIDICFEYPETIEPGPRGKFRFVVRETD